MTVQEFITRYDTDHENAASNEQKIRWLQRIEMTIMSDVMYRYNERDKPGMLEDVILYGGDVTPFIDGDDMDISKSRDLYIDGSDLVVTSYDPMHGRREADNMNENTMLMIPVPYDNVYEYYLSMQIADSTGNTKEYNRAAELFNQAYYAFRKYYARTHKINRNRNHLIRHGDL